MSSGISHSQSKRDKLKLGVSRWRELVVLGLLFMLASGLLFRAGILQIVEKDYLQSKGDARYQVIQKQEPLRGMIVDRNDTALAVSTPVDSISAHPPTLLKQFELKSLVNKTPEQIAEMNSYDHDQLCRLLGKTYGDFVSLIEKYKNKQFVYLKRHMKPQDADRIIALEIPGIHARREYKRYYPASPDAGHLLGFTNIDNEGLEGIERIANKKLTGSVGQVRLMRNRHGQIVEELERIKPVKHGGTVKLSIDLRIQHLADQYLNAAVKSSHAESGTLVALDAKTGEILALANVPYFNSNDRRDLKSNKFKNRAITDVFEPGSTMKPFAIAMALDAGVIKPDTVIKTQGVYNIEGSRISDTKNHGDITAEQVIVKSSNIGSAKIARMLPAKDLVKTLRSLGFGEKTAIELLGQQSGRLSNKKDWRAIEHATLSYGYGLSATTIQLAKSYTVFANNGELLPVTLWAKPADFKPEGDRVFTKKTVQNLNVMLQKVVEEGTAKQARLPRHTSAGKTGTIHLINKEGGGYLDDSYASIFAGYAPASAPEIVMAIVITDPKGDVYYGGQVAGPVFSKVMDGALRYRNVAPDRKELESTKKIQPSISAVNTGGSRL